MSINVEKLSITQLDKITAFNNADELEFIMDELQETTLAQEEEITDITGRGGRKIGALKKNKSVTGTGTNGVVVGGALAAMLGGKVENGKYKVRWTDENLVVKSNKVTVNKEPVGTAGSEIVAVHVKNKDGSLGKALTQDATVSEGKFTYASKAITFNDGQFTDGTELVAFYDIEAEGAKIANKSNEYSKTLKLYIDCEAQDTCDNVYHGQFIIYRADFHGTFDIAMGSDPTTQAFEFSALAGGCAGNNYLWEFIVFE